MEGEPEITVDDPGNGERVLMEENRIQDQALEKKIDEEDETLTAQEVNMNSSLIIQLQSFQF